MGSAHTLSSRERMLAAVRRQEVDHVPCCFMIFSALAGQCRSQEEFIERQLDLGLDTVVALPDLALRLHPDVAVRERVEGARRDTGDGGRAGEAVLCKEYHTPAGVLTTRVRRTRDWPHGDHVPLFDDYLIPRSDKFLVTGPEDLPALRYLLAAWTDEDLHAFRERARELKRLASNKGLLVTGGWGGWGGGDPGAMGVDAVMWLCGIQQPLLWGMEQPEMLGELASILAKWNRRRLEVCLDAGVDLLIKRAWYETTDLWSPALYRRFILPVLKEEVALAHQAGTAFACIMTSGVLPLADALLESGLDVLIGVDPVQGKGTTLGGVAERLGGRLCLWGGVNGFLTVEMGSPAEVEDAVAQAMAVLGARPGFILSPVDNVRDTSESTWRNVEALIGAWRSGTPGCYRQV